MLNNFTLFLLLIIISHHGDNLSIVSLCFCQALAYILLVTLGNTFSNYCSHQIELLIILYSTSCQITMIRTTIY